MPDILTTTQEFAASGSLAGVEIDLTHLEPVLESQAACQFLQKKVDELIVEVNKLKNA